MMTIIVFMGIFMPLIYFTLAIKWWVLFTWVLFIFAISTPDYLVDKNWNRSFARAPFIMLGSLFAPAKAIQGEHLFVNKNKDKNKK